MKTAIKLGIILLCILVTNMEVSDAFARHIESVEGFKAKAYQDSGGVWTIGFGHVIKEKESGLFTAILTREQATSILKADVAIAEAAVNRLVTVPLKQEQFDALVSFVFNIGEGQFARSTLLKKLNAGHCCAVPDEMRRFKYDNGKVVAGLIARRAAEVDFYVGNC